MRTSGDPAIHNPLPVIPQRPWVSLDGKARATLVGGSASFLPYLMATLSTPPQWPALISAHTHPFLLLTIFSLSSFFFFALCIFSFQSIVSIFFYFFEKKKKVPGKRLSGLSPRNRKDGQKGLIRNTTCRKAAVFKLPPGQCVSEGCLSPYASPTPTPHPSASALSVLSWVWLLSGK